MKLTHFSLFSGVGGIDLAAEWAGFTTVGQCEFADYPTKVLEKHWPSVPRWRDVRDVTVESVRERGIGEIMLLSGGFPCQPFSNAGQRRGTADDRHLWPEMLRVIAELRPRWVLGENVAGIIHLALDEVLSDLEGQGYTARAIVLPACGVGAPHRRDRVFIVAHATGGVSSTEQEREYQAVGRGQDTLAHGEERQLAGQIVADTECGRLQGWILECPKSTAEFFASDSGHHRGHQIGRLWDAEPGMGRLAYGIFSKVARRRLADQLRCLGNAIVPQQVYPILAAIAEIERSV